MKRLSILGSTGSIGTNTLAVVDHAVGEYRIAALAAGRNLDLLERQVAAYKPDLVCTADGETAAEAKRRFGDSCRIVHGKEGILEAAAGSGADLVVCGLVGAVGLPSAHAALQQGIDLALANKEALVVGGEFMTAAAARSGAAILPVDSEHNAIHQCLRGESDGEVRNLWLTASGGPFRDTPASMLDAVTVEQALRHPTWKMGPKITIDSATLMNKGLEVIEARWLFDMPAGQIKVVVHPQSVIHSMVEFVDGSFKAQLGATDMRHPIQYALTWPRRVEGPLPPFNPVDAGPLTFDSPDTDRFPCLALAYQAVEAGGTATAVLNAANEVAVQAFLDGRAGFTDIPAIISETLGRSSCASVGSLQELLALDQDVRRTALDIAGERSRSC